VGYQAQGTLGRLIVDGIKKVRIHGKQYPVRANIVQVDGFSSHADKNDLMGWLGEFKKTPRHLFVTHGEPEAADAFADEVKSKFGWKVSVPAYLDGVMLE
jgi:metallo-beta-lactamase family protein